MKPDLTQNVSATEFISHNQLPEKKKMPGCEGTEAEKGFVEPFVAELLLHQHEVPAVRLITRTILKLGFV